MVTAPLLSLLIVPAAYALMRRRSGAGASRRPASSTH
jgi:Cu/Ag efflux pump CusA